MDTEKVLDLELLRQRLTSSLHMAHTLHSALKDPEYHENSLRSLSVLPYVLHELEEALEQVEVKLAG